MLPDRSCDRAHRGYRSCATSRDRYRAAGVGPAWPAPVSPGGARDAGM